MTGLYVHIPFCEKKCHYCDFVTAPDTGSAARAGFLDALEAEIAHEAPRFEGIMFDTLYAGGGTPSRLDERETERFFAALRSAFRFSPGAEVTWEANPGDVDSAKAREWRSLGVNRVSLGAQSFDDAVLARLGRAHGEADTERTFAALRAAGFDNVSLDLMLALPGQTSASARESVERVVSLSPEHVSVYELTVEPRTPFGEKRRRGELDLPSEEEALGMLVDARGRLESAGLVQYELLSHARPGRESRHNRIYWDNRTCLGLGPGAYSYVDGRRSRRAATLDEYLRKCRIGDWSDADEETLGEPARRVESLLLALRLVDGADLAHHAEAAALLAEPVARLEAGGLLERRNGRLALTERGRLFAESVFSELSGP